jgi:hypothetical protein
VPLSAKRPARAQAAAARAGAEQALRCLMGVYFLASLGHFAHNALELHRYPHMPAWLSGTTVMGAWLALTALGLAGYGVYRSLSAALGLALIGLYGLLGLDALAHYAVAPFAAHTWPMHASILGEALAGLLLAVGCCAIARS